MGNNPLDAATRAAEMKCGCKTTPFGTEVCAWHMVLIVDGKIVDLSPKAEMQHLGAAVEKVKRKKK